MTRMQEDSLHTLIIFRGKAMKILKISMLTLLLTLCAAVAVITIIHLSRGGGAGETQLSDYGSDSEAAAGSDYAALYDFTEEERML